MDRSKIRFYSEREQQDFCLHLRYELTIAGRTI